jgi:archaetidylinositol phosphate synthase
MSHVREHRSLLAAPEKRLLIFIARRLPRAINSDHLTALALLAMGIAGAAFAASRWDIRALWFVVIGLGLNWFGDSLDGTLARVRHLERPRYGFYVDHVLDLAGATLLLGGLACSPFVAPIVALGVLIAYLLVSGEVFLATSVRGVFKMSVAGVGPTELRILLAAGTMALFHHPVVSLGRLTVALFDAGGVVAATGLIVVFVVSVLQNASALAVAEER